MPVPVPVPVPVPASDSSNCSQGAAGVVHKVACVGNIVSVSQAVHCPLEEWECSSGPVACPFYRCPGRTFDFSSRVSFLRGRGASTALFESFAVLRVVPGPKTGLRRPAEAAQAISASFVFLRASSASRVGSIFRRLEFIALTEKFSVCFNESKRRGKYCPTPTKLRA